MEDQKAKDYLKRFGKLESGRGIWDSHWQEVSDRVMTRLTPFNTSVTPGSKRTDQIFDATACHANQRFAAAVESVICPRAERWHGIEPQDPDLANDHAVKRWCEELADLLFRVRYGSRSAFASETQECFLELGAFGTMAMMVDDITNHRGVYPLTTPIVYQAISLSEIWIEENSLGQVDTCWRKFQLDARQAIQQFGEKALPEKIVNAFKNDDNKMWTFIHCVHPTLDHDEYAWDYRVFPYTSCYVNREEQQTIVEEGYRRNPYAVSRSITAPGECYGRSPAMTVLPDIKMLNEIQKTTIKAAHKAVMPPLLLADDGMGTPFDLRPDALNFGHVDQQGRQLVHPLQSGSQPNPADKLREELRRSINDSFYITLFQILVENKQMTAYEAALRAQEKGQLLAPVMGRQEAEFLAPVVEREIDILWRRGIIQNAIGPMPESLMEYGGAIKVVYRNQMTTFQKSPEATRTLMAMQQLAALAQFDSSVMDGFDPDGVREVIMEANLVPEKAQRTPEALKKYRIDKQAAFDQQKLLEAAPVAASAAKDLSTAAANATGAPPKLPLSTLQ